MPNYVEVLTESKAQQLTLYANSRNRERERAIFSKQCKIYESLLIRKVRANIK